MKFGVVVFPGSNCDLDAYEALRGVTGRDTEYIWHETASIEGFDCILLPGGFSYGDYLRAGAIARFSPVMQAVRGFAKSGGLVLGICNGFQILCEAGLLPGALLRNRDLKFHCEWVHVRVENNRTPFTNRYGQGQVLRIPIAHGEGRYHADPETLARMEERGQVVFRYCTEYGEVVPEANPNGSVGNIAGVCNERGNVLGLMPHPERAVEGLVGGTDGRGFFESLIETLSTARARG